jgi:flagellar protein FliO/FliZ
MQLPVVDSGATILTTAGYLCLLLGVIYLAYYMLKRFGIQGMMGQSGTNGPYLVSRLMLGNRQSVAVVRYKDKELVLGVTEERINVLSEGEVSEDVELPVPTKNFASFLKRSTADEK